MALTIKGDRKFLAKGAIGPLFQVAGLSFLGVERQKGPTYGEQWVFSFESAASNDPTKASPAEVAYHSCPLEFVSKLTAIGPKHQLTISCPVEPNGNADALSALSAQYELLGNEISLDLREHPKALALGPDKIAIIDGVLNHEDKTPGVPYTTADLPTDADSKILYGLLRQRNGNATFQTSQYVFKYSYITNRKADLKVAYSGNNQIYSTAKMLLETITPEGILSAVDDAVASIRTAVIPVGANVGTYKTGWLKKAPTVTVVANNKVQISGEFVLEFWSDWIYGTA
jgi:hypothetical protein